MVKKVKLTTSKGKERSVVNKRTTANIRTAKQNPDNVSMTAAQTSYNAVKDRMKPASAGTKALASQKKARSDAEAKRAEVKRRSDSIRQGREDFRREAEKRHAADDKRYAEVLARRKEKYPPQNTYQNSLSVVRHHHDKMQDSMSDPKLNKTQRRGRVAFHAHELLKHAKRTHNQLNDEGQNLENEYHDEKEGHREYSLGNISTTRGVLWNRGAHKTKFARMVGGLKHGNVHDLNQHFDREARKLSTARNMIRGYVGDALHTFPKSDDNQQLVATHAAAFGNHQHPSVQSAMKKHGIKMPGQEKAVTPAPKKKKGIVGRVFGRFFGKEEFEYPIEEEGGAGEIGTDELLKKYKEVTPGEYPNPLVSTTLKRVVSEKLRFKKRAKARVNDSPTSKGVSGVPGPSVLKNRSPDPQSAARAGEIRAKHAERRVRRW